MALIHGGDSQTYIQAYGKAPLDFSANGNPLGVPPGVRAAICAVASQADRYPDPLCRVLRAALGRALRVPDAWILCGNGAADLIWRLAAARKPRKVLLCAPTFSEYEAAVRCFGGSVFYHYLKPENGFRLDRAFLEALTADTDMVFLTNPNNPTGVTIEPALLMEIVARCACHGTLLVVDECFNGFLDEPAAHTLLSQLRDHPHLLLLRAFTKLYGMAGLRLGFCLSSDAGLLQALAQAGQPWPVSSVAQSAGIAALREGAYLAASRSVIRAQRAYLQAELSARGLRVFPGEANYLLFHTALSGLGRLLREQGIVIRDCANYEGLTEGYFRIAVLRPAQNRRLLEAMDAAMAAQLPGGP